MTRILKQALALVAVTAFVACARKDDGSVADTSASGAAAAQRTLHDRLGGTTAIASVVDGFVANVAGDARINKFFTRVASDTAAMREFNGSPPS